MTPPHGAAILPLELSPPAPWPVIGVAPVQAPDAHRVVLALGTLGADAEILPVEGAADLLACLEGGAPDVLVLAGEGALDLCRSVRRRWSAPALPILVIGARPSEAFAAGASDGVSAVWSADEVGARVAALARSRRIHAEALAAARVESRERRSIREPTDRVALGLDLLTRASEALMGSLETRSRLAALTRLVVPELADFCGVYLADERGDVRLYEGFASDPDHVATARVRVAHAVQGSGFDAVLLVVRKGRSVIHPELTDGDLQAIAADADDLARLRACGLRSWLCAPLVVRGRTLGALACGRSAEAHPYDAADLGLVEELGRLAALAIENARLFELAEQERRRAEEANQLKDEFLANLSHELRTPLTAILGWARILRTRPLPEEKRARALEAVERNAVAQARLVEDLLDVSRIIAQKLTLDVAPVDPALVIETAIEALRPAAEQRGLALRSVIDGVVGPVPGDFDRLRQVVVNLLANAVKFTPAGGSIEVQLTSDGAAGARIAVTDTGEGIRKDFLPFVFDRFRQADGGLTRAHGGLGIGLAIVRHLVELHGGSVDAHSAGEGLGATFTVHLPAGWGSPACLLRS